MEVKYVKLTDIRVDQEFNCRGQIAPVDVVDLVKDIQEKTIIQDGKMVDCGLLQPVILMPDIKNIKTYFLVGGYRRFTAFKILERTEIPAVIKQNMSLGDALAMNLCENLKRKDLNVLQEAYSIRNLFLSGMNRRQICEKTGCSDGWVQIRTMILELPKDIQEDIKAGYISQTDVRDLHSINKKGTKEELYDAVRQLKDAKFKGLKKVNIKRKDYDSKRERRRPEITSMLEHVMIAFKAGLATRCLAWASGEITTNELFDFMEEEAKRTGRVFIRP